MLTYLWIQVVLRLNRKKHRRLVQRRLSRKLKVRLRCMSCVFFLITRTLFFQRNRLNGNSNDTTIKKPSIHKLLFDRLGLRVPSIDKPNSFSDVIFFFFSYKNLMNTFFCKMQAIQLVKMVPSDR